MAGSVTLWRRTHHRDTGVALGAYNSGEISGWEPGTAGTVSAAKAAQLQRDFGAEFDAEGPAAPLFTPDGETAAVSPEAAIAAIAEAIDGIGLKSARRLYDAGFRTAAEVLAEGNRAKVLGLLPPLVARQVLKHLGDEGAA